MKTFRTVLFWMHLATGVIGGVVILLMSVTGVALTYEKQMIEWADRRFWSAPSPADARHLSPETLLAKVLDAQPGAAPIGMMLSYSWAGTLVYRLAGEKPPSATPGLQAAKSSSPQVLDAFGLNAAWETAARQAPDWRSITTRAASPEAPITVTVDRGYAGQPQKRITLAVDRRTGTVIKAEGFANLSAGRRARSWLRFAHTGEFYGLAGQTIAGLASAGGAVLVYTGLALALRRLRSWIARRRAAAGGIERQRAA